MATYLTFKTVAPPSSLVPNLHFFYTFACPAVVQLGCRIRAEMLGTGEPTTGVNFRESGIGDSLTEPVS